MNIRKILLYILAFVTGFSFTAVFSDAYAAAEDSGTQSGITLPIVMYHQLCTDQSRANNYVLTVEQFEKDLSFLSQQGYTAIGTDELYSWCSDSSPLPVKPVMITFDDGYETTWVYAAELLEKYGMKAVVSVIGSVAEEYTALDDHTLKYAHMSWDEIAACDRLSSVEIQCHTYDMHRLAPRRGCGKMKGESDGHYVTALKEDLELFNNEFFKHTGRKTDVLALPFGFFCPLTIETAKSIGFKMVFTCSEKLNHLTGDKNELYSLCRFNRPQGKSSEEFFSAWESR